MRSALTLFIWQFLKSEPIFWADRNNTGPLRFRSKERALLSGSPRSGTYTGGLPEPVHREGLQGEPQLSWRRVQQPLWPGQRGGPERCAEAGHQLENCQPPDQQCSGNGGIPLCRTLVKLQRKEDTAGYTYSYHRIYSRKRKDSNPFSSIISIYMNGKMSKRCISGFSAGGILFVSLIYILNYYFKHLRAEFLLLASFAGFFSNYLVANMLSYGHICDTVEPKHRYVLKNNYVNVLSRDNINETFLFYLIFFSFLKNKLFIFLSEQQDSHFLKASAWCPNQLEHLLGKSKQFLVFIFNSIFFF